MHVDSISLRFGLIIEAYCYGSPDHVPILLEQVETLSQLEEISLAARPKKNEKLTIVSLKLPSITVSKPETPQYYCQ